jgi:hypothetical protein
VKIKRRVPKFEISKGREADLFFHMDDCAATNMIEIGELDPNTTIWRYLPFERFASLIQFRALWFSRLRAFHDLNEGITPAVPRGQLKNQHRLMENWFPDEERKSQVRRFQEDNEEYGRDLIVATCWFIDNSQSKEMWAGYASHDEDIAIRSTVGDLAASLVKTLKDKWWIGKVSYVDLATYDGMNAYQASQACQRAFLKGIKYSHEKELRVATMNFVAPGYLNPDGSPQTEKQRLGFIDASNGPGIFVTVDLNRLIKEVRTAPHASDSHFEAVALLVGKAAYQIPVMRSGLS